MPSLRYVGPFDEVEIPAGYVVVKQGESFEVDDADLAEVPARAGRQLRGRQGRPSPRARSPDMGAMDHQLWSPTRPPMARASPVTRFFEYESESIEEEEGRTEGDPLRVGSHHIRSDRFTPYFSGASGSVEMAVMSKGFGFWLKHMLGQSATTGPAETTVYTHTGSEAELLGDSFTLQVNRPFHPAGTNQAFTYRGGKVTEWTLSNSVDENLMLRAGCGLHAGRHQRRTRHRFVPDGDGQPDVGGRRRHHRRLGLRRDRVQPSGQQRARRRPPPDPRRTRTRRSRRSLAPSTRSR